MSTSAAESAAVRGAEQTSIREEGLVTFLLGLSIVLVIMNTMMFDLALPRSSRFRLIGSFDIFGSLQDIQSFSRSLPSLTAGYPICPDTPADCYRACFTKLAAIVRVVQRQLLAAPARPPHVQASGEREAIPALSLVLITRYVPMERRGKAMAIIMSAALWVLA